MGNISSKEYKFYRHDKGKELFGKFNGFTSANTFSLEEDAPIQKSQKIFEEAKKVKDYEKYVEALKSNNTDEKIIFKNLEFISNEEEKKKHFFKNMDYIFLKIIIKTISVKKKNQYVNYLKNYLIY